MIITISRYLSRAVIHCSLFTTRSYSLSVHNLYHAWFGYLFTVGSLFTTRGLFVVSLFTTAFLYGKFRKCSFFFFSYFFLFFYFLRRFATSQFPRALHEILYFTQEKISRWTKLHLFYYYFLFRSFPTDLWEDLEPKGENSERFLLFFPHRESSPVPATESRTRVFQIPISGIRSDVEGE